MVYNQGLHILAEIESNETLLLSDFSQFRTLIDGLIVDRNLHKVGEVYHGFENAGFTAVVCLTESHISIHTWPEFGRITFDVFLSNFLRNNDETGRFLLSETVSFFKAINCHFTEVRR